MRRSPWLLVLFFACQSTEQADYTLVAEPLGVDDAAIDTPKLRIMAANLTSGNQQSYDPGNGQRILQAVKPDVVLIQEFNVAGNSDGEVRAWVQSTFTDGNYEYTRESNAHIPNGIISRYPIKESGVWDDPNTSDRNFVWARIDIPGDHDLVAVSVHLLTSSPSNRSAQAKKIVTNLQAILKSSDWLAIGGDFNTKSRTEGALQTLSQLFEVNGPFPADQKGNGNTNSARKNPYDWVLVGGGLDARHIPLVLGSNKFPAGIVVDTRSFSPISDLSPAKQADSGAANMQHMGVVRDFALDTSKQDPDPSCQRASDCAGAHDACINGACTATCTSSNQCREGDVCDVASHTCITKATPPPPPPPSGQLLINEVLANEPSSDVRGEFIEVLNGSNATIDLTGYALSGNTGTRHQFSNLTLAPGQVVVVFGDKSSAPSTAAGAVVSSSNGTLKLSNSKGTVTLLDKSGATIDQVTYDNALANRDGVSMNRSQDGVLGTVWVLHDSLAGGNRASPGLRYDLSHF